MERELCSMKAQAVSAHEAERSALNELQAMRESNNHLLAEVE